MRAIFGGCALFVADIAASRRFYEELLGQTVLLDNGLHLSFEGGFAIWRADDAAAKVLGEEAPPPGPQGKRNCELYFETPEVDRLARALAAAGAPVAAPLGEREWGQRVICVLDPDGHLVEIGEPAQVVVARLAARGLSEAAIAAKSRLPLAMVAAFLAAGPAPGADK